MFLWPCIVSKAWGKKTNKMQQYRWFIVNSGWVEQQPSQWSHPQHSTTVPQTATSSTTSKYTPHALTSVFLLKMGIKMTETCWDSVNNQHPLLKINHLYCCILLVFFPHALEHFVLVYNIDTPVTGDLPVRTDATRFLAWAGTRDVTGFFQLSPTFRVASAWGASNKRYVMWCNQNTSNT